METYSLVAVGELPQHTHTASTNTTGSHAHTYRTFYGTTGYGPDGSSDREKTINTGSSGNHTHQFQLYGPNGNTNMNFPSDFDTNYARNKGTTLSAGNHSHTININNTGSSQSHNNMQPYLAVYMWKRTA